MDNGDPMKDIVHQYIESENNKPTEHKEVLKQLRDLKQNVLQQMINLNIPKYTAKSGVVLECVRKTKKRKINKTDAKWIGDMYSEFVVGTNKVQNEFVGDIFKYISTGSLDDQAIGSLYEQHHGGNTGITQSFTLKLMELYDKKTFSKEWLYMFYSEFHTNFTQASSNYFIESFIQKYDQGEEHFDLVVKNLKRKRS